MMEIAERSEHDDVKVARERNYRGAADLSAVIPDPASSRRNPRAAHDGTERKQSFPQAGGHRMSHPSPIKAIPDSVTPPFAWREEAPQLPGAAQADRSVPPGRMDLRSGSKGPVTASRHRRNALVYGALCVVAILPVLLQVPPGWQAFGLGLFM